MFLIDCFHAPHLPAPFSPLDFLFSPGARYDIIGAGGDEMIERFIEKSGAACIGGFIAYYNDMSLYAPDPAVMLSRAVAILVRADRRLLICPADLTLEDRAPEHAVFRSIERDQFAKRSTGALFAQGRYFSIRSGDLAGSYQISDDLIRSEAFPNPRAYRQFLLGQK